MAPRLLAAAGALFLALSALAQTASSPAERDWQVILELAGGPGTNFRNRDEAVNAARKHLDRQETTLRAFIAQYPEDAHRYSARIRLASVLRVKSRVAGQPPLRVEGQKLLTDLRDDPQTPAPVKADAGFAILSETMQDFAGRTDDEARAGLKTAIRQFDADFPGDRRFAGTLVELATLYDDTPADKRALLEEAQTRTAEPSLRRRIADDFRRLSQLGKPVDARLKPHRGGGPPIDLTDRRGRATVLLFWASWSAPSLRELARLEQLAPALAARPLDFVTVSLDDNPRALEDILKATGLTWPVHCDGKGWQGELVRGLGINALPTVWVLDRKGALLTLNARDREQEWIERALR